MTIEDLGNSSVSLVWVTPEAESLITYMARVSNPTFQSHEQQTDEDVQRLIRYCMDRGHWSIFEMANMTIEIHTTRAIAAQILRHRSFSFQEFSQRYQDVTALEAPFMFVAPRRQDNKNRQSSHDDLPEDVKEWWNSKLLEMCKNAEAVYTEALSLGIAKECSRFILPMLTGTKMYMNGNIRSWITYFKARLNPGTQKEHRDVALAIFHIFESSCPLIGRILRIEFTNCGFLT